MTTRTQKTEEEEEKKTSWWMVWLQLRNEGSWQGRMHYEKLSPLSGKYPEFKGAADKVDPSNTAFIDFVKLLWPDSLCEHIAEQINLYATQCNALAATKND